MTLLLALVLTLEQSYGPYARPAHGGDPTVAVARDGALLAWSEGNRIRLGMLDAQARLSPGIRTLPVRSERSVALAPAAASDGFSYFLAWIELESGLQRTMGMAVGFDGVPLGEPRQYGKAIALAPDDFAVRVVWDGDAYRLWTAGGAVPMPSSVAAANGVIATTSSKISLVHCGFSWCWWRSDVIWTVGAREGRVLLREATGPYNTKDRDQLPLPPTAVAGADGRFVVAWSLDGVLTYLIPGDGSNRVAASAESVRPGLACDGTDCVIAYARSKDVHAFAFETGRLFGPEMIAVAATERMERVPQVHALGGGRFLVLYRSDGADGEHFRWRVIAPEPPARKARAMR